MKKTIIILISLAAFCVIGFSGCFEDESGNDVEDTACFRTYLNGKNLCANDPLFVDLGEEFNKTYCQSYMNTGTTDNDAEYECKANAATCEEYNDCS
ncbi:MAG: hypothetical protein GY754_12255 [bacterium]|nr:hypothetical protein [bacterium]